MERFKNCKFQIDLFENLKNKPILQIAKDYKMDTKNIKGIEIQNNDYFIVYSDINSDMEIRKEKIDLKFEDLVKYFKNIRVFIG